MRALLVITCLVTALLWLAPASVGAADGSAAEKAALLENSLQAVEWYTNESVRKALQAESAGDHVSARLLGNKAIESDLRAKDLRNQTAAAWEAAGKPARAKAAWNRAAAMARERALMLAKRIPEQLRQWQLADGSDHAAGEREHEILYLQAVYLTAQQWDLVARFASLAGEQGEARQADMELKKLLPALQRKDRLSVLSEDQRLAGSQQMLQVWQQRLSGTSQ